MTVVTTWLLKMLNCKTNTEMLTLLLYATKKQRFWSKEPQKKYKR